MLPRLFGNENESRKFNGTISENGCGKFSNFDARALSEIKEMGFTHIWFTGVLEQASGTDYPCRPADHPSLLKGVAGSPYAIRDYFNVCPDYADNPETRLEEFRALLERCAAFELKAIIDFVPNHVARSYQSHIAPELSFGSNDRKAEFFHRDSNFFYLQGEGPLVLPNGGVFEPEREHGRVTGNNAITWTPSVDDWYETVKLNYGHDFTQGSDTSSLRDLPSDEVPDTWKKMNVILGYWQEMGVNGFRVDMAHMVPLEFWEWVIAEARQRDPDVFFTAEAYDSDPAKLTDGNVLDELLIAGFDAVYDDQSYDLLMAIYDGPKWANDLDEILHGGRLHRSLRYAENHDEVRLASPKTWGGLGFEVGKPVTGLLFSLGRGPTMIYSGQEVGEQAQGAQGFGGDDGRTTIFDYWSMASLNAWTNKGRFDGEKLTPGQKELREWYSALLKATASPAFANGEFYGLNHLNKENPNFGRSEGEGVSGHWVYAFLRSERKEHGETVLVVVNLHPTKTFYEFAVSVSSHAREWSCLKGDIEVEPVMADQTWSDFSKQISCATLAPLGVTILRLKNDGFCAA